VSARDSTLACKGRPVDVRQAGGEPGAHHLRACRHLKRDACLRWSASIESSGTSSTCSDRIMAHMVSVIGRRLQCRRKSDPKPQTLRLFSARHGDVLPPECENLQRRPMELRQGIRARSRIRGGLSAAHWRPVPLSSIAAERSTNPPNDPFLMQTKNALAWAHFLTGRHDEALSWVGRVLQEDPIYKRALRVTAQRRRASEWGARRSRPSRAWGKSIPISASPVPPVARCGDVQDSLRKAGRSKMTGKPGAVRRCACRTKG
jgi:hypothetical protein